MRIAYLFPHAADVTPAKADQAQTVTVKHDATALERARGAKRLRCIYLPCLWQLTIVHDGDSGDIRHFAHWPSGSHPECPYRAKANFSQRDIVHDLLGFYMRLRMGGGGSTPFPVRVTVFHPDAPDAPASLADSLVAVAAEDLPHIPRPFPSSRPIVVIRPDLSAEQDDRYVIVGEQPAGSAWPECSEPLETLDWAFADYARFGLARPAEHLYIPNAYKQALEILDAVVPEPRDAHVRKLSALLSKRLLVDGARIHRIVFGQSLADAQRFFLPCDAFPRAVDLPAADELARLRDSPERARLEQGPERLRECCRDFFEQALVDQELRRERERLGQEHARAVSELRRQQAQELGQVRARAEDLKAQAERIAGEGDKARQEGAIARDEAERLLSERRRLAEDKSILERDIAALSIRARPIDELERRWWGRLVLKLLPRR